MSTLYDALLFVSFGGPEGPDDVMPFLENVLRGRNVPRERMLEVAEHYHHFGGISPINAQTRELIEAVRADFAQQGLSLPIYWGNRNWQPLLPDTIQQMAHNGVKSALAFFVSAYSSYSGCRQYRENVAQAQETVGTKAPVIHKLRMFYNHPEFIAATVDKMRAVWDQIPVDRRETCHVAFTAHSIPTSMSTGCDYVRQLTETCRLVAERLSIPSDRWQLVYQSRSGRPEDPWLAPDIGDHLRQLRQTGVTEVVVMPIGFLSDHMEVLFDLDYEAAQIAAEIGLTMHRAETVGTHPLFVTMIRKLVLERMHPERPQESCGQYGPNWDLCPADCCPAPRRRPAV